MTTDKRLIEYYIPIKAISAEASREKSIRHGHISTLHLWWARRPLVASRAAVFAALVPWDAQPQLVDYETGEPYTLTKFMTHLCKWEVSDDVLDEARRLIRESYPDNPPKVLDMFAGGDSILLEALRLGAEAYALGGKALASEPIPGAARDERYREQRAIDSLLASWRRVVDEGKLL
jgi:putative DNA methylase